MGLLPRCLWLSSRSLLLKIEIQFLLNNLVCFGLMTPNMVHATNATKITASFFFTAIFHFLFLSYQYLVKYWFRRIAAFLVIKLYSGCQKLLYDDDKISCLLIHECVSQAPVGSSDRADQTLPDGFQITTSSIPGAGLGIFATKEVSLEMTIVLLFVSYLEIKLMYLNL